MQVIYIFYVLQLVASITKNWGWAGYLALIFHFILYCIPLAEGGAWDFSQENIFILNLRLNDL